MEYPTYRILMPDEEEGIFGLSLVDNPANRQLPVMLKKDQEVIKYQKDKMQLVSPVLIPNQKIPRKDEKNGLYNLMFPEDAIEALAHKFITDEMITNSWYNHTGDKLKGLIVVESWLKTTEEAEYGFSLPKGTWMVKMQLTPELWENYVVNGKVKGISIDGFLNKMQVEMFDSVFKINKQNNMKNGVELIKKALVMLQADEVAMATLEVDGVKYVSDSFAEGEMVYIEDAEGDRENAVSVTIENEGILHTTNEDGVVISVLPVEEEVTPVVEDAVEPVADVEELAKEDEDKDAKVDKAEVLKMIQEDKELFEMLKEEMSKEFEKEKVEMKNSFSKEKVKLQSQFDILNTEHKTLMTKLDEIPAHTKLSAISDKGLSAESTFLERINNINSKNK